MFSRLRDARERHEAFMRETIIVCPGITPPVKHGRPKLSLSWRDRQMPGTCRADAKIRQLLLPCIHLNANNKLVNTAKSYLIPFLIF